MTQCIETINPVIWSISGHDCSGGAGISADIKTVNALVQAVELCPIITANTTQNSNRLIAVNPVEVSVLNSQARLLLEDKPPTVIKIGLLANQSQVNWLVGLLTALKTTMPLLRVVFDPVAIASVGQQMNKLSVQQLMPLLALVDVITPNQHEAQFLAQSDLQSAPELAKRIISYGIDYVVIKGGHESMDGAKDNIASCIDRCYFLDIENSLKSYQLHSRKVDTSFSHGGGCAFASAIASFLAQGYLVRDALTMAKAFINKGLEKNSGVIDHYGSFNVIPLTQHSDRFEQDFFPQVLGEFNEQYQQLPEFLSIELGASKLGLYPVIDSIEWLEKLLPLKLEIIQLRLKNLPLDIVEKHIIKAVALAKQFKTRLFINDHWQLAIKHQAYGVHLGQEDLAVADLQQIQQAGLRLGISTHGCYEFLLSQQLAPSYLAIGAIFPTKTKDMTGQIQGLNNLTKIMSLAKDIPVVAIGGITLERSGEVMATGVSSIAVVTAITEHADPETAVAQFKQTIGQS